MNARAAPLASLIAALGPGLRAQSLPSLAELQARARADSNDPVAHHAIASPPPPMYCPGTSRWRSCPRGALPCCGRMGRFGLSGRPDLAPSRYTDMIADAKERLAHLPPQ